MKCLSMFATRYILSRAYGKIHYHHDFHHTLRSQLFKIKSLIFKFIVSVLLPFSLKL